jgi:hypothetical protein
MFLSAFSVVFGYGSFAASLFLVAYTSIGYGWIMAIFYGMSLAMMFVELGLAVGLKWLILGRQRPGTHPLWGWYYIKWWLARGIIQTVRNAVRTCPLPPWHLSSISQNAIAER